MASGFGTSCLRHGPALGKNILIKSTYGEKTSFFLQISGPSYSVRDIRAAIQARTWRDALEKVPGRKARVVCFTGLAMSKFSYNPWPLAYRCPMHRELAPHTAVINQEKAPLSLACIKSVGDIFSI